MPGGFFVGGIWLFHLFEMMDVRLGCGLFDGVMGLYLVGFLFAYSNNFNSNFMLKYDVGRVRLSGCYLGSGMSLLEGWAGTWCDSKMVLRWWSCWW